MKRLILFIGLLSLSSASLNAVESGFGFLSSIMDAEASEVEVSEGIAYALFGSGLLILDVSGPADPVLLGRYFFHEKAEDLRLMGESLIVANGTAGIQVIDVSDPSEPGFTGIYHTGGEANGLELVGDTLFVANGSRGLLVLALDAPGTPQFVAELTEVAPSYSVDVEGDYAFLADFQRGLDIVRVSSLPDMELVATVSEWPCLVQARDIRVSQSHAYVADSDYLATVDVSDPTNPVLKTCIEIFGRALDLFIELPYLYLASDLEGFHTYEIVSNPDFPGWQSTYDTPDDARGISVEGAKAAVADDFTGILMVDVENPADPESLGTFPSAGENRGGVIVDDIAYLAQGAKGVTIADIRDPVQPGINGTFSESISFVHSLYVRDTLLVIANGFGGLMTVNISDPLSPLFLGEVETGRQVTEVRVSGNMAFVVDGDFHVVDISNPLNPAVVSSYITPCFSVDLAVTGSIAFIADRDCGVLSFDISAPGDSIRLLSTLDTPGIANGIAADEDFLYLADGSGGFRVIHYNSGGEMEEQGQIDPGDDAIDVAIEGSMVYLTLEMGEIVAVDVGDPGSLMMLANFPTPGSSVAVATGSSLIMVGDVTSTIFFEFTPVGIRGDHSPPPMPERTGMLRQNYPNPFNPSTTITFHLPAEEGQDANRSTVSLEVFSLRGHRVKELYRDIARAGEHVVTWDGTNSSGESVSSGIYIYVLKIGEITFVRKMLLVR